MLLFSLLMACVYAKIDPNVPDPNAVNVKCTTTKGNFSLVINPSWAPRGAARFLEMVDTGFFDKIAAYRVVPNFLVQFGVPFTNTKQWPDIFDDPNVGIQDPVFKRGMLAFAGYAPNTRGTEAFISYQDTPHLGKSAWGNPFGMVTEGMSTLDRFYSGYGDLADFGGKAPDPNRIRSEGGAFLKTEYPLLDYITACARVGGKPAASAQQPLPSCAPLFCGQGIARPSEPTVAVCICHELCKKGHQLPCCPSFQEACPAEYAKAMAPVAPAAPAPKAGAKGPAPAAAAPTPAKAPAAAGKHKGPKRKKGN